MIRLICDHGWKKDSADVCEEGSLGQLSNRTGRGYVNEFDKNGDKMEDICGA